MDPTTRIARARSFKESAPDYDAVRPGYPQELFVDLLDFAQPPGSAEVLEIGCGTGQATRSLVDLDLELTCLEPSASLCKLAQAHFSSFKNVRFFVASFEEYEHSPSAFNLIFAATSFHWLDPNVRLTKCADLLVSGGALAVFSSTHPQPYTEFFAEVQEVYDRHVPEWARPQEPGASADDPMLRPADSVLRDDRFSEAVISSYNWSVNFSTAEYLRLLRTFSDHIRLGEDRLRGLTDDIGKLIDARYEGRVTRPYATVLHMARRLPR
jgi:SAM-dependent methyltransferase